jgi:hypothetical protein
VKRSAKDLKEFSCRPHHPFSPFAKNTTMSLIGVVLLLFLAFVALLVTIFDALGRVVVAAVGAIARAPWHGGQLIRHQLTTRRRARLQQRPVAAIEMRSPKPASWGTTTVPVLERTIRR